MPKKLDLIGKKFGRLFVISESKRQGNNIKYLCKCDCGNMSEVFGFSLNNGNTKSCGCLLSETTRKLATKHSHTLNRNPSPEYRTWSSMIQRCTNPNNKNYKNYGERKISVCDRWMKFENFIEDMGERPCKNYSIERLDVNGNYEPENCIWADKFSQSQNIRIYEKNKTGVKGCFWHEKRKKYIVDIGYFGKHKRIGYFDTLSEAAEARKLAEEKYWKRSS